MNLAPGSLESLLAALRASPVSASARRRARLLLADTLGCAAAGFAAPEVNAFARGLPAGTFRWPGAPAPLATGDAAFAGALAACWDEACEGLARAHGRPGVASIAAALPVAMEQRRSLGEALDAIRLGYEIGGRLGEAMRIRPGMHVDATWTAFAAAAAAAQARGLDDPGVLDAIELAACQMPVSLYLPVRQGVTGRNLYLGHASRLGVDCALAAQSGIGATRGALEEARRIALGGEGPLPALADPAVSLLEEGYLKPYAAVRHVHYGAAAAAALRPKLLPHLDRIESVELSIYAEAITYCGNRAPRSPIQAQFSLTYGVAAMLLLGDLGPDAYRRLSDAALVALEAKVTVTEDAARTRDGTRGATLTVRAAGRTFTEDVERVSGDPGQPMTEAEERAKFMRYAGPVLGENRASRLHDAILGAPESTPLADLLA